MNIMDTVQYRAAKVEDIEGHELLVRAVPYDLPTDIGGGITETFKKGAFAKTEAHRLTVFHDHGGPLVGRGVEFRDEADGPYIRAKIGTTAAAEEMLTLLGEGILDGQCSIEFRAMKNWMTVERDGERLTVVHRRAHLTGFALVPEGAYGDQAKVLAYRDSQRDRQVEAARAWFAAWRGSR